MATTSPDMPKPPTGCSLGCSSSRASSARNPLAAPTVSASPSPTSTPKPRSARGATTMNTSPHAPGDEPIGTNTSNCASRASSAPMARDLESSMNLDPHTALIPIDVQQAFDAAPWPPRNNPAMESNGLRLLEAWRASRRPLSHVKHDSVVPGSTLAASHPGNALRPGFEPRDDEPLVRKSVNAAFIGTDLDLRLRRPGITSVVPFGLRPELR